MPLQLTLKKTTEDTYTLDLSKIESSAVRKQLQLSRDETSLYSDLVYIVIPEQSPGNYDYKFEFNQRIILKGNLPPNTRIESSSIVIVRGNIGERSAIITPQKTVPLSAAFGLPKDGYLLAPKIMVNLLQNRVLFNDDIEAAANLISIGINRDFLGNDKQQLVTPLMVACYFLSKEIALDLLVHIIENEPIDSLEYCTEQEERRPLLNLLLKVIPLSYMKKQIKEENILSEMLALKFYIEKSPATPLNANQGLDQVVITTPLYAPALAF